MRVLFLIATCFLFIGCKRQHEKGIEIGSILYAIQTYEENKALRESINGVLHRDIQSFQNLISYDCRGGAGCYDLGFITVQLALKLGTKDFINLANQLESEQQHNLYGLFNVGVEYGSLQSVNDILIIKQINTALWEMQLHTY